MKRSVGIDISDKRICIVQLQQSRGGLSLERVFVRQLSNETSAKENSASDIRAAVKAAISEGEFDTRVPVVVAMPYGTVFFCKFRTGISNDKDIRQLLKYEVEDDFPIPFDDLVVDTCGYHKLKEHDLEFLVGAVNRSKLQDLVEVILEAGIDCSAVSADVCALHAVAALNCGPVGDTPSLVVYMDSCRTILVVIESNGLVCARHLTYGDSTEIDIPILRREIELTLRAISKSDNPVPSRILLSGTNELVCALSEELSQESDSEIVKLDPLDQIKCSPQQQMDGELAIASGLALMGLNRSSKDLDFLAADRAKAGRTAKTKRSVLVFGFLFAAVAALLVAKIFIQLTVLEDKHERIKQEIREVFTQTLPEEKRIVNEFAQMTERFKELQEEYNTLSAEISGRVPSLIILQRISENITSDQNVSISGISIASESVRLSGIATSFESVDNLVGILRQISEFDSVELQNVDKDPASDRVRFRLLIALVFN
ncbi:type II secretion system protein GspL [Planctomycetota bacterium]